MAARAHEIDDDSVESDKEYSVRRIEDEPGIIRIQFGAKWKNSAGIKSDHRPGIQSSLK